VAAFVVLAGTVLLVRRDHPGSSGSESAPYVGGDLHAVATVGGRLFVSGHDGAGYSDAAGTWTQIGGLSGKDGMGWAAVPGGILVGGHEGLYRSTDRGVTFGPAPGNLPVTDVHALGSSGTTVYLASPQQGLFASTDGGQSWTMRSAAGKSFMGTMAVDPTDPKHLLAPDMASGVTESRDGGRSWRALGGPSGAMSVAAYPNEASHLVAVGMAGAAETRDGGMTWQPLTVPDGTAVVTLDRSGALVAAVHAGSTAEVYRSTDNGKAWTRI